MTDPDLLAAGPHASLRSPMRKALKARTLMGLCGLPFWLWACASAPSSDTDWTKVVPPPVTGEAPQSEGVSEPIPPQPAMDRAAQGPFQPNAYLRLCRMQMSNAPPADRVGYVAEFSPLVVANDRVILATAPVNDACLSSGFGPRGGRMHKGVDLVSRPAGTIYSAAPGIVREARWGRGFGWYVTLDHGHGVYTRYAHLERFEDDIAPGKRLGFGQPLGLMGRTGNATAVHLHYEVLTGRWGRKGSFGLTAVDPLTLPVYDPYLTASAEASSVAGGAP